jgi:hypothetical protein
MATIVQTKTVNLCRLPVYCGMWGDRVSYHKYNIVTYYGSSFINLVEGNAKYPVQISFDASNRLESYKFEDSSGGWTGWMFVANSYDASIYATKMGDYAKYEGERAQNMVDENFFTLDVEDDGDIVVTYSRNGDGNIKNAYIEQDGDIILEYDYSTYREVIFNMKTNVGLYPAAGFVVNVQSTSKNYTVLYYNKDEKYIECKYNDVTNLPQTGILEFRTPDNVLHTQEYNSFIVQ